MRLRNRVRALQKEEERVTKKIAETEWRIARAVSNQEEKQQRARTKELRREIEQKDLIQRRQNECLCARRSLFRERNLKLRNENRQMREKRELQILQDKFHMALETKHEKQKHKHASIEDKDKELRKAQARTDDVKKIEFGTKKKLEMYRREKMSRVRFCCFSIFHHR